MTDSTSYLPPGLAEALDITVVPLEVVLDGVAVPEPDVDPAAFYARLRDGGTAGTSQPAPGAFLQAFDAVDADRVLCLTATATMSGTHQSAVLAATMTDRPVDVVDSGTISGGLCLLVLEVARALTAGAAHDEVLALARALAGRVCSIWSAETTALLAAGGRLGQDASGRRAGPRAGARAGAGRRRGALGRGGRRAAGGGRAGQRRVVRHPGDRRPRRRPGGRRRAGRGAAGRHRA